MIAIVNISGEQEDGFSLYEVRINTTPIVQFYHKRSEVLSKCLKLAAIAVEMKEVGE